VNFDDDEIFVCIFYNLMEEEPKRVYVLDTMKEFMKKMNSQGDFIELLEATFANKSFKLSVFAKSEIIYATLVRINEPASEPVQDKGAKIIELFERK